MNEVPFSHPWDEARIGDVADVIVGGTPSTSVDRYWGGSVRWMASGDVHLKRIVDVAGRISREGLNASNAKIVEPPAVAIALAGQGKTRGTAAIVLVPLCTNQSVALIKSRSHRLDAAYLYHCFEFRYEELRSRSAGAGRAGLSKGLIEAIPVPLPKEHVQQKIAEVLDTVDRVIGQAESLIAKYLSIKTGLMQDLLTRGLDEYGHLRRTQIEAPDLYQCSPLGCIPKDWEVGKLGGEIGPIISGWSPNCEPHPAGANEWAILKTTAVVWNGYCDTENKRLPDNLTPVPSLEVKPDDILITRKGPVERVGVVVHVAQTRPRLMIPDTVFKVRLRPHSKVTPAFLPLALASTSVQRDWFGKKIGLADAQVDINHGIVNGTLFPLPPPPEQEKIVLAFETVRKELLALTKGLEKHQRIKNGLARDLLTGRISLEPIVATQTLAARS